MGLRDRIRAVFGRSDEDAPVVEPPVDRVARRAQLDRLEAALRTMASAMAADGTLIGNPGWRGRVEDYRWAANEAAAMGRTEFTRAETLDLANQIAPLYAPGGAVPAEYAVYETEQARLLEAVEELRRPLPSEEIAP